jgi:hypothetical protein
MSIEFTRIKNDVNGNPRYVCHFLALNTREELDKSGAEWIGISEKYAMALARAHKIGGRKYHNKKYGGGIVFQCYGAQDIEPAIIKLLAKESGEVTA